MTASGYAIRAYRPGDEGVIVDMFNRVFGTADPEFRPRDVAYFDWKYLKNPAGFHSLVAEDPDGRVVAHYGGVPIAMRVDGASTAFGQNCDAYSDPAIRRGLRNPGTFVRLAQAYASTYAVPGVDAVMYGLPVPEHYRIGVKYLDYWMLRTQFQLTLRDGSRLPPWDWNTHAIEVTEFPEDVETLTRHLESTTHRCVARRDAAFLNWRFARHPWGCYRMAVARPGNGGDVLGIAVYTKARFGQATRALLVDWYVDPESPGAAASLMRWVVERGTQDGLNDLVTIVPPTSVWWSAFLDMGFEAEPTPYVMTARPYDARLPSQWLRDHWYYTLADFDLV